jgi:hypothetical protein
MAHAGIRHTAAFALGAFCAGLACSSREPESAPLEILESYTIPAAEISGLAWRPGLGKAGLELVVVSDRDHALYFIDWAERRERFAVRAVDLEPLLEREGLAQSEWESVFSDASRRIYIIQEHPARILVVSPELDAIEFRIELVPAPGDPHGLAWDSDVNSRGEGLQPLANGHVLVLKEKDPLRIIEFAPAGRSAEGYAPRLCVERQGVFRLPAAATSSLMPVFAWRLSPEWERWLDDSSGLNVDPEGALYILADRRSMIARIGKELIPSDAPLEIDRLWSLPGMLEQPEGMVIDERLRPVIAIDRKQASRPNLFLLSPLE